MILFIFVGGTLTYWVSVILMRPLDIYDVHRKNMIISTENKLMSESPSTTERRKKQYAQEIQDKKIKSNVITVKVRGAGKPTTTEKNHQKYGITAIPGITK